MITVANDLKRPVVVECVECGAPIELTGRAKLYCSPGQRAALLQQRLGLGETELAELADLEQIPWSFAYEFTCNDDRCRGHEIGILDWEIGESYRRWVREYGDRWEEKLRERYEIELPARDLHLVVGNLAKRRRTFEIIGLVRPPRPKVMDGGFVQESLDLMGEQRPVAGFGVGLEAEQAARARSRSGAPGHGALPGRGVGARGSRQRT